MKIIEITDSKVAKMSALTEEMLTAGGKLMLCLEKLANESYGERMSRRDHDYDDEYMHERRMGMRYHDYDDDVIHDRRYGNRYR